MEKSKKKECPDCLQIGGGNKIPCETCDGLGTIDYTKPVFAVWGESTNLRIIQENT